MRAPSPQRGEGRGGGGRGGGGGPRTYEKILGFRTPHPRSLRSHSRSFGSAFFTLRTASEGRLRSPLWGEVKAERFSLLPFDATPRGRACWSMRAAALRRTRRNAGADRPAHWPGRNVLRLRRRAHGRVS